MYLKEGKQMRIAIMSTLELDGIEIIEKVDLMSSFFHNLEKLFVCN